VLDSENNVLGVISGAGNIVQGPVHVPTGLNYFTPIRYIKSALENEYILAHFVNQNNPTEQERSYAPTEKSRRGLSMYLTAIPLKS
jgi:hypothetical protein